jgi:hypothetical protein
MEKGRLHRRTVSLHCDNVSLHRDIVALHRGIAGQQCGIVSLHCGDGSIHRGVANLRRCDVSLQRRPFYQFHNCQDDTDALTGLVMQLLGRIPNTDPDCEAVALQVETFKKNVDEILTNLGDEDGNSHAGWSESIAWPLQPDDADG